MQLETSSTRFCPGHVTGPALKGISGQSSVERGVDHSSGANRSASGRRVSSRWNSGA